MVDEREVWSVSRLNREVALLLETGLAKLWVEGELSNIARPASGHWYFTLKDESAQVRCAMFRQYNARVQVTPAAGMQVLVRARVSIYQARGDYQLIVEHLEEAGHGALQRAFEALKAKLAKEGLFDEAAKRPLPVLPRRVGVITSPSGAAVRDVLSVLKRRFPAIPVVIYPVPVQGEGAAERIAAMLAKASARAECDVLILTRGGGSLEDLWSFNEEGVARAIRACDIPVVCGVGHEVDFTIADFAADLRAPTPSAAAELVVPDRRDYEQNLQAFAQRMLRAWQRRLDAYTGQLRWLAARLKPMHPGRRLQERAQRLDELDQRLGRALRARLDRANAELPGQWRRLVAAWRRLDERAGMRVTAASRALHSVSPLATLGRGFAIVMPADRDEPITDAGVVKQGDRVRARLHKGELECTVDEVKKQ